MAARTFIAILGLLLIIATVAEGAVTKKFTLIENSLLSRTVRWTKDGKTVVAPAAGDSQVYVGDLLHPTTKKKIGTDTGYCIYTDKVLNICTVTATLKDGSITYSGAFDDSKLSQALAVVGGTGAYVGAKGSVTMTYVSTVNGAVTVKNVYSLM